MRYSNKHERPSDAMIRKVIRKARKLLKAEPNDLSAARRGNVQVSRLQRPMS